MREPRTNKTFSLSQTVIEGLEQRSHEQGEPMSRIVEAAVQALLALPVPERDEDAEEGGLAPTRTETAMLDALRKAGPGWHYNWKLADDVGVSPHVGTKALKALQRRGEAFLWGPGDSAPKHGVGCWGLRPGLEVARALLSRAGRDLTKLTKIAPMLSRLALAMGDDAKVLHREFGEAIGAHPESWLGIESFAERAANRAEEDRAESQRAAQAAALELKAAHERIRRDQEIAEKMDKTPIGPVVVPDVCEACGFVDCFCP